MLPLSFTTRPINTLFAPLPLPYKAASNSNLAETFLGIDGNQPLGEGFVNDDQTRAIVTVTISSTGILIYQYHSLE